MKRNKKTAFIGLVSLALVAGGSAALVTYFGSVDGTVDVEEQALTLDGEIDATYTGDAAPETAYNLVDVSNNNNDRFVSYKWRILDLKQFASNNAHAGVYETQQFGLYEGTHNDLQNLAEDASHYVDVTPNVDEVEYEFFEGDSHVEIIVSPNGDDGEDNMEVTRFEDGSWMVAVQTNDEHHYETAEELVNDWEFVRGLDEEGEYMTVTFESRSYEPDSQRNLDSDQSIAISIREDGDRFFTEHFEFDEQTTDNLVDLTFENRLGLEGTVNPSGQNDYNVGVFLDSDTPDDEDYELDVELVPVTAR